MLLGNCLNLHSTFVATESPKHHSPGGMSEGRSPRSMGAVPSPRNTPYKGTYFLCKTITKSKK